MSSVVNSCELEISKIIMSSFVKSYEEDVTKKFIIMNRGPHIEKQRIVNPTETFQIASQFQNMPREGFKGGWGGARAGELGRPAGGCGRGRERSHTCDGGRVFEDFEEDFEEAERRFGPLCSFCKEQEAAKRRQIEIQLPAKDEKVVVLDFGN
eukprot:gene12243-2878_t